QVARQIVLIKKYLALQVIGLDEIAVSNRQVADARPRQVICQHCAERAAADDRHARCKQTLLARAANSGKQGLARVTVWQGWGGLRKVRIHNQAQLRYSGASGSTGISLKSWPCQVFCLVAVGRCGGAML